MHRDISVRSSGRRGGSSIKSIPDRTCGRRPHQPQLYALGAEDVAAGQPPDESPRGEVIQADWARRRSCKAAIVVVVLAVS